MSILFAFLIAWAALIFTLKLVDTLNEGALSRTLERNNVTLKFGYFSFQTTQLNSLIDRFAQRHRRQLAFWFDFGVYLGLLGLLFSVAVLSFNIIQTLTPHTNPEVIPVFGERSRVPFTQNRPPWLPRYVWSLFTAADHHHSSVNPKPGEPDLPNAAKLDLDPASGIRLNGPGGTGKKPGMGPSGKPGCKHSKFADEFGQLYQPALWATKRRRRRRKSRHPHHHRRGRGRMRENAAHISDSMLADLAGIDELRGQSGDDDLPGGPPGLHGPPGRHHRHRNRRLLTLESNSSFSTSEDDDETDSQAPKTDGRRRFLTPLVPGVTVPAGDVWYMLATVLVAAVVHEFGHGIAAAAQDGEIASVGGFVAMILPGAFVKICGIELLRPYAQLRVFCAGAWHNLVSGALALFMVCFLSILAAPVYSVGKGALVVGVPPISPLSGHVLVGDLMHELGGRRVVDGGESFRTAVRSLVKTGDSVGFCVSNAAVRPVAPGTNSSGLSCCGGDDGEDGSGDCFRMQGKQRTLACVNPDLISSVHTCRLSLDCGDEDVRKAALIRAVEVGGSNASSGRGGVGCYIPVFEKGWQLVDVRVWSGRSGEKVHYFFEGPPHILGQSLTVSSYVPRVWDTVPWGILQVIAAADVPNIIERFLQYMASISFGLAVLNMAPVLYLDGEASSGLFVKWLFPSMKERQVKRIRAATVLFGSGLMIANMFLSLLGAARAGNSGLHT